ncbi:Orn Lys Arg decarboxylase class-II [Sarracenia purpurea var. burkii]
MGFKLGKRWVNGLVFKRLGLSSQLRRSSAGSGGKKAERYGGVVRCSEAGARSSAVEQWSTTEYESQYQGVYPVKCNQDRFVVEDIVKFGSAFRFRLEAGSKLELLLAMSCLCKGSCDSLLVCNG